MFSRHRAATAALAAILWGRGSATARPTSTPVGDIHLIQHVVVIMQENRSFDHYFGTYPGADGIPMDNGTLSVCVTDPMHGICVKPYHDPPT
jgi:phospholipase C